MRFSSSGCQPCKSRRKKCDGASPICRRCANAKRVCFGAQLAFSNVNNENAFASGQRNRPRGPRSKPKPASDVGFLLSRDVQSEAVAYYMHQHLEPIKDASNLIDSPRKALLSNWNSSAAVREAVSAIALALFSKTRQCSTAAIQSQISYRRSLKTLQCMLNTLSAENVNQCLLTVCFMNRYEDAVLPPHSHDHIAFAEMHKGRLHSLGIIAVLEFWRHSTKLAQEPTETIKYARRVVRKAALFGRIDLPDWLRDGRKFGERDLEQAFDAIIIRIIYVRSNFLSWASGQGSDSPIMASFQSHTDTLLTEIRGIDQALVEWIEHFPGKKHRIEHEAVEIDSCSSNPFYHNIVYSYHNHAYAAIRAQYYGHRILVRSLEMQVIHSRNKMLHRPDTEDFRECSKELNNLARKLASTIPFCLERFIPSAGHEISSGSARVEVIAKRKPYVSELVVSPLLFASGVSPIEHDIRVWYKAQLMDVARLLGYGILELTATSNLLKF